MSEEIKVSNMFIDSLKTQEEIYYKAKMKELYEVKIKNLQQKVEQQEKEIERLNNIIGEIERLIINHNCDTGDIYYKYNGKYLKSELKERIMELVELKEVIKYDNQRI